MSDEEDYTAYVDPEEARVAEEERLSKLRANAKVSAYATIISTYEGRKFLWDLLATCGVWSASYGPDMAFREGQRDIGIRVMREISAVQPDVLHVMSMEFHQREAAYASAKE